MALALDAEDWGAFQLVQAEIWADQRAIAPASSHGGIPAWNLGVLADLGEGDATLTLLLLSYSDRAAAEAAAARIEEGWDEELPGGAPMHQITGVTAEIRILGEGPFVTVVAMEAPLAVETGWPSNSIYRALSEQGYGEYLALVGPE
jgi:hypothetical protein